MKISQSKKRNLEEPITETFFVRFFTFLTLWNLCALMYAVYSTLTKRDLVVFPNSYGDYERFDLFLTLVQANFENPYEFNEKIPNLRNQPYLPGFYLFLHGIGYRMTSFEKNAFWVHVLVFLFLYLILRLFWKIQGSVSKKMRLATTLGAGLTSVPFIFLFTTGNIQSLIVIAALMFYKPLSKTVSIQRTRDLFFSLFIASTKPQFLLIALFSGIRARLRRSAIILGVILGGIISLFGLSYFGNSFLDNFKYWQASIQGFITSSPAFVVHNNASIIGNLSSIELYFFPEKYYSLFVLQHTREISLLFMVIMIYFVFRLWSIPNALWLKLWFIVSLSTLITPVSYNYNLTLFLIPLAVLFGSRSELLFFSEKFLKGYWFKINFALMMFVTFGAKPIQVWLIPGVADTNLFNMVSSFSLIGAIIFALGYIRTKTKQ